MSQYSTGTATVTNNSATVTGTNTLWLANVTAGDSFTVAGDGVMYDVASVDSDTQVTLSVNYAGSTASGVVYAIGTGFTVPDSFPEMSQGDIETATTFTRGMRKIQGKFSSILAGGANANFTTMPQVGGDPIVESGSNADGEWTRWADGTQVCWLTLEDRLIDVGPDGGVYYSPLATWVYPKAFTAVPSASERAQKTSTGGVVWSGSGNAAITTTQMGGILALSSNGSQSGISMVTAHGRWK
jgi:hypothetical protein